jgi:hypothetical protein
MDYGSRFFLAAWMLMAVAMCAFGFVLVALEGWGAVAPGLVIATIGGALGLWGWHISRASTCLTGGHPEVLAVPEPVDGVLTIRKMSVLGLIPILLFCAMGWAGLALSVGSVLGLIAYEGSAGAGLLISVLFVLFGQGALMEHAVTVRLDLRLRHWEIWRGVWPIQLRNHGDLTEASHVAVAQEARWDEGAEYEVLVARLEWRDGWRAPLVLGERPNHVDGLRYGGDVLKLGYRLAMIRWASGLAGVLDLPLMDRSKDACGAEC